jgi:D-aminoacyl-tRNA deacylase
MILLAASSKDIAGVNITKQVLGNFKFSKTEQTYQENPVYQAAIDEKQVQLATLKNEAVNAQELPEAFPTAELIIFLSRHSSQSGKPTLSVHTPGNFGSAELGGLPRALSIAPAKAMCDALKTMAQLKTELNLTYEVSYECTHHGPSLNVLTMFVELGSTPQQWQDETAAKVVAEAAMHAVVNFDRTARSAAIGIGGTHYNARFTQLALDDKALFGHMIPKYALPNFDAEILRQCVERTLETVNHVILDWKGIKGNDKPRIVEALREVDLPYEKI